MFVAVAGNVGSGKTTLAKYISEKYGFHYIPQRRLEFDFINDFFEDIEGKFFPAQVAFLLSKAIEIQELANSKENIVVDRSLLEDIEVFARLWIENRDIDSRIIQLYHHTADFIRTAVPEPDIYIICRCSVELSNQRIAHRKKRDFEQKYPPNHIQLLGEYYSKLRFGAGTPYIEIDTEQFDFTDSSILQSVCECVISHIDSWQTYNQLSLFDNPPDREHVSGLIFKNFNENNRPVNHTITVKKDKYIYLAAPFSQFATENLNHVLGSEKENSLFSDMIERKSYGELPARYRNLLLRIAKSLEKQCGMSVLLPHRDINNWGKTTYDSHYLTPKIISTVEQASALVAIPGSSVGVHMEIGIAIAKKMPIVVFVTQDIPGSFFVEGFANLPNIKCIEVSSTTKIASFLESNSISDYIKK